MNMKLVTMNNLGPRYAWLQLISSDIFSKWIFSEVLSSSISEIAYCEFFDLIPILCLKG